MLEIGKQEKNTKKMKKNKREGNVMKRTNAQKNEAQSLVVPPAVATFIEKEDDPIYEMVNWVEYLAGRIPEDPLLRDVIPWFLENKTTFYEAVVNGCTSAPEPLYRVLFPDTSEVFAYNFLGETGDIRFTEQLEQVDQLTEKAIRAIDERYWPFAVPVETVES